MKLEYLLNDIIEDSYKTLCICIYEDPQNINIELDNDFKNMNALNKSLISNSQQHQS